MTLHRHMKLLKAGTKSARRHVKKRPLTIMTVLGGATGLVTLLTTLHFSGSVQVGSTNVQFKLGSQEAKAIAAQDKALTRLGLPVPETDCARGVKG